jgi:peroxiredoxin Q/BCP
MTDGGDPVAELVRLEAGERAPDFTLPDQNGAPFRLSSTRGSKVVLYFYGEASTPACTTQACDFRDNFGLLSDAGYRVIGISRDKLEDNQRFAVEERLSQVILSDPERGVHALYGTFGEKQMYGRTVTGVIRATFVLDEAGVITMPLYNIKATGHVAMLLKRLRLTDRPVR